MPDSFQLVLPEPDPDEEPLEVAGRANLNLPAVEPPPSHPPASLSALASNFARERTNSLASRELRQLEEESWSDGLERDPDELWQENATREAQENLRFSLAEMFYVTALLAIIFTTGRYVRLPWLAGILGVLVLLGLGVISHKDHSRVAYVVWITLIAGYVLISIGAAWKTG